MKLRTLAGVGVMIMTLSMRAQDPLKTLPNNYWVEFENASFKVIHVRYRPHEKVGVHDHPGTPTLYVYLSDSGPVRFEHAGHDTFDLTRKPLTAGQMRLSPGRIETHRVENLGDVQSEFLRVELKTLPLGFGGLEKRVPSATEAFWKQAQPEETEFDGPGLRVTRIGVASGKHAMFHGTDGDHTLWIAVHADGAQVAGKAAHAGEAWDTPALDVQAGNERVELVRVDLK